MNNATIGIKTITPEIASELLANKLDTQRKLRQSHVDKLSEELRQGTFRLSNDAILIIKGRLANGQHRLSAVQASNIPGDFLVMESDDEKLYQIIDSGIKRTLGDALSLPNANTMAAVARLCLHYDKGAISTGGSGLSGQFSRSEQVEYAQQHIEAIAEAMKICEPLYGKTKIVNLTVGSSFVFIATRAHHKTKAIEFISDVYTGRTSDTAAKDLRDRLIKNAMSPTKFRTPYLLAITIKAFKSYLQGTRPGSLRLNDGESFPKL